MQFNENKIKNILKKELDWSPNKTDIIPIREGYFSNSYKVCCDNTQYFLRISPPDDYLCLFYEKRMTLQEPEIHKLILAKTKMPVPKILLHNSSRKIIDRDYVIMEFLPGKTLRERNHELTIKEYNNCLFQWGEYIHELHTITKDVHGYTGAHRPMTGQSNWVDAFCIMWEKIISDCYNTGCYTKEQAGTAVKLLEKHIDSFKSKKKIKASLMHMDLWVTNVLLDKKGNVTGVIDFDRACWGDPEIEFSILNYCGLAKQAFYHGYNSFPQKTEDAKIRFQFYTLYEHQKYIVICMSQRRNNPQGARMYAEQSIRMIKQLYNE